MKMKNLISAVLGIALTANVAFIPTISSEALSQEDIKITVTDIDSYGVDYYENGYFFSKNHGEDYWSVYKEDGTLVFDNNEYTRIAISNNMILAAYENDTNVYGYSHFFDMDGNRIDQEISEKIINQIDFENNEETDIEFYLDGFIDGYSIMYIMNYDLYKCLIIDSDFNITTDVSKLEKETGLFINNNLTNAGGGLFYGNSDASFQRFIDAYGNILYETADDLIGKGDLYEYSATDAWNTISLYKSSISSPNGLRLCFLRSYKGNYAFYIDEDFNIVSGPFNSYDSNNNVWINFYNATSDYIPITDLTECDITGSEPDNETDEDGNLIFRYGLMNRNGEVVISAKDNNYTAVNNVLDNSAGLWGVQNDEGVGYVDFDNNVVIPFEYEDCTSFINSRAYGETKDHKLVIFDIINSSTKKATQTMTET